MTKTIITLLITLLVGATLFTVMIGSYIDSLGEFACLDQGTSGPVMIFDVFVFIKIWFTCCLLTIVAWISITTLIRD